jgi:hypothetical protein
VLVTCFLLTVVFDIVVAVSVGFMMPTPKSVVVPVTSSPSKSPPAASAA